jgi:iron complex transport system ATP-binding protein
VISFRDVVVRYDTGKAAVDGVSFDAAPGVLTALVGPNGSGKSSLVRALLARVPVPQGRITLAGVETRAMPRRELALRLAVVSQREEPAFPVRVHEYVALGRYPHRGAWTPPTPADAEAVRRALHAADATEVADRMTDALSGGEWQRVRLARAIAQETDAIVLDEPTTFLDIAHEMSCFELLSDLAETGKTVLVVSHQLNLVARFAHTVILLASGRVAASGPPDEVMRGETLERVYEWPLVISRDPAVGAPTLVPLRKRRPPIR